MSEKERFSEDMENDKDMMVAYGCVYLGCFSPTVIMLIISLIGLIIWQTKFWLFSVLVMFVLILFFQYLMKLSVKGNYHKWKRNGEKFKQYLMDIRKGILFFFAQNWIYGVGTIQSGYI